MNAKTVSELKKIAKERGLKGYSKLKKQELINLLNTPVRLSDIEFAWMKDLHLQMKRFAAQGKFEKLEKRKKWLVIVCEQSEKKSFDVVIREAALRGYLGIVKTCKKRFENVHDELFKYHRKRMYDELLSIAWHPDRFFDWCLDENEKLGIKDRWSDLTVRAT